MRGLLDVAWSRNAAHGQGAGLRRSHGCFCRLPLSVPAASRWNGSGTLLGGRTSRDASVAARSRSGAGNHGHACRPEGDRYRPGRRPGRSGFHTAARRGSQARRDDRASPPPGENRPEFHFIHRDCKPLRRAGERVGRQEYKIDAGRQEAGAFFQACGWTGTWNGAR